MTAARGFVLSTSFVCATLFASEKFTWKWRQAEELTYKQTLRASTAGGWQKEAIAAALRKLLADKGSVWETAVKLVDLNRDGVAEVIAQGPGSECSATGNCPMWVLGRVNGAYKLLLKSFGQTFTIQGRTNGYSDIVVSMHGSAWTSTLHVFQYRDGAYHEARCYDADWGYANFAAGRKPKQPELTPCAK